MGKPIWKHWNWRGLTREAFGDAPGQTATMTKSVDVPLTNRQWL